MKKFIKFMSLLLVVPMLGVVSLFTGCGKDEVSLSQVMESYNNMVIKYQSDSNTNIMVGNKNSMFTFTNNIVKGENNSFNYFNEGSSFDLDFDIDMTVLDVSNRASNDLKIMYNHLIMYEVKSTSTAEEEVQEVTKLFRYGLFPKALKYSNLYFKKYQKSFFEASPDKFDEEALGRLNNKIKNLDKALENFHNNMVDRTELIGFYGSDTKVMESKLATFNSIYIDLISANYDFVLEFCNIHRDYVMNVSIEDSINNNSTDVAERYAHEAFLKYSYGYFLDNIKSFQNNNLANTVKLASSISVPYINNDERFAFDLQNELYKMYRKFASTIDSINDWGFELPTDENELNSELTNKKKAKLKVVANQIQQSIARYDVFLGLYQTNASKFDMYTYNQLRHGSEETMYANLDDFKTQLNAEQEARLTVIENFTTYDCLLLAKSLNNILVTSVTAGL